MVGQPLQRAGTSPTGGVGACPVAGDPRDEDIDLIRNFMPVPRLDRRPVQALHDRIGDAGILRGFVWGDQAGCWQHAACLYDIIDLIIKAPGAEHRCGPS